MAGSGSNPSAGSSATSSSPNDLFGQGSLYGAPFTLTSDSGAGGSSISGKGTGASGKGSETVTDVHPGAAVGVQLWTGGPLIPLVLLMALSGVLGIPAVLTRGRRRGKW